MSIEEFFLTNLGDLSGWGAFAVMVFLYFRNTRADNKEQSDVAKLKEQNKAQELQLQLQHLKSRDENTEAVKELTKTAKELNAADLAAHKTTHDSLGTIQDTQTGIDRNVVNLIASLSHLEASFNATAEEFREKHKETAKELAQIGLQVSSVKNALTELVHQRYPNPADTQEIPPEIQAEARSLSGGATTLVEGVILSLEAEASKNEDSGEKAA